MAKIAIITDSIACFTREMVERYWIRIVPSNTHFDGRFYKEYLNTSSTEAYHLLEMAPNHFSTSAPSPADYLEAYRKLIRRFPGSLSRFWTPGPALLPRGLSSLQQHGP